MANPSLFKRFIASMSTFVLALAIVFPIGFFSVVPLTKAATYTVSNLDDGGAGSLRQAITDANGNGGADIIDFNDLNGTINLSGNLPQITGPVTINGQQATSVSINTSGESSCLEFNAGSTGSIVKGLTCVGAGAANGIVIGSGVDVTVGGTSAGEGVNVSGVSGTGLTINGSATVLGSTFYSNNIGIKLNGATSTEIGNGTASGRNLIHGNVNDGMDIQGASSGFDINDNYIGTSNGTSDNGNGNSGILIWGSANSGTIRNNTIIGNTQNGINVKVGTHTIQGNKIGINTAGADVGNDQNGINVESSNNIIGGSGSLRNIISGNGQTGVNIDGNPGTATGNTIQYNYIGTNLDATGIIANNNGVVIKGGSGDSNIVQYNVISGNTLGGIQVQTGADSQSIYGNTIGLNAARNADLGNGFVGIEIQSDSNQVGDDTDESKANYISGNADHGLWINGGDSNIIERNKIGVAGDNTTKITNDVHAVALESGATGNMIGGTTANTDNLIAAANSNESIINISTAGNNNSFRRNVIIDGAGVSYITRGGTSNENIAVPIISASDSGSISGTAAANNSVDIFAFNAGTNKISWMKTVTADGNGDWSSSLPFGAATKAYATQTTATGSTSGITAASAIANDTLAPSVPVVTSHLTDTYYASAGITLSGSKEANSSIWINGSEAVAHDGLTTWSYGITLSEGANAYSITSRDGVPNESAAVVLNLNLDSSAPAAPSVSNPISTGEANPTLTITGEANQNILLDGVDTGRDTDATGTGTITLSLPSAGSYTFAVQLQSYSLLNSPETAFTITRTSTSVGAGGGGGGGSSSSSSSSSASEDSSTEESSEEADDTIEESLAGEEEVDDKESETPLTPPHEEVKEETKNPIESDVDPVKESI